LLPGVDAMYLKSRESSFAKLPRARDGSTLAASNCKGGIKSEMSSIGF
jgi:hypothetical protein